MEQDTSYPLTRTMLCYARESILYGDDDNREGEKHLPEPEISEEAQMRALLGFGGFETTKGQQVLDNVKGPASGAVRKHTKREYKQFMNKRGGFGNKAMMPPTM